MSEGVLYNYDKEDTWQTIIIKATVHYHSRITGGISPNECHVHPGTKTDDINGIRFVEDQYILPNHLWIGRKE